jgi:hypothetical protein
MKLNSRLFAALFSSDSIQSFPRSKGTCRGPVKNKFGIFHRVSRSIHFGSCRFLHGMDVRNMEYAPPGVRTKVNGLQLADEQDMGVLNFIDNAKR